VVGYIEPLSDPEPGETVRFENNIVGNAIPPSFLPACEKGFKDATNSGQLIGHPVEVTSPPPQRVDLQSMLCVGSEYYV